MELADVPALITTVLASMAMAYTLWVSFVIFLASIGKSFGARHVFSKVMLLVFEWGKQRISIHERRKHSSGDQQEERGLQVPNSAGTYDKPTANGNVANYDGDFDVNRSGHVIERVMRIHSTSQLELFRQRSIEEMKHEFQLSDAMVFCKSGIESIIEDEVTQRFDAEDLMAWNLLTRTNVKHEFISYRLTILWFMGWVLRYIILFPFRLSLAVVAISLMISGTAVIGYFVPEGKLRRWCYARLSLTCYRIMSRSFSSVITFHNKENRAKGGGICVANHTSPIDIIILGCDNTYAMVGQEQGGFFGIMQRAFSRAESHIWFHRSEAKDRHAVQSRLREHVEDPNTLPILIFPEGTCINNTSIMMFKKGSFETGGVIYPVAIKYDSRFADPFWNSSKQHLLHHLLLIMSSWALVCDVWYLPPEKQLEDETAIQFANRIKSEIARKGGLVDLEWDGGLKRASPKPSMKEMAQHQYSQLILTEGDFHKDKPNSDEQKLPQTDSDTENLPIYIDFSPKDTEEQATTEEDDPTILMKHSSIAVQTVESELRNRTSGLPSVVITDTNVTSLESESTQSEKIHEHAMCETSMQTDSTACASTEKSVKSE